MAYLRVPYVSRDFRQGSMRVPKNNFITFKVEEKYIFPSKSPLTRLSPEEIASPPSYPHLRIELNSSYLITKSRDIEVVSKTKLPRPTLIRFVNPNFLPTPYRPSSKVDLPVSFEYIINCSTGEIHNSHRIQTAATSGVALRPVSESSVGVLSFSSTHSSPSITPQPRSCSYSRDQECTTNFSGIASVHGRR
ncbi:hypothetical protein EVAR_66916_1 [Eumeta japonica]|uniref:Uncharacterized protein n=1 Tax=Eumeta variegata TaxID=151549 RepID=A0A4C1Z5L7_EUMVA|nr:hypothetical protein EVAR_66916_1 [Eumeta japonica]